MILDMLRASRTFIQNFQPHERRANHREAVGSLWDKVGPLQFEFMKRQGLLPHHRLLDIGCGSLRAGRLFIPYLDAGNYLGLDADESLVQAGLTSELDPGLIAEKSPRFAVNDSFVFPFAALPDFAIAQSLFTHLTLKQIELCLANLRHFAPRCRLYATFNETPLPLPYFFSPHSQRTFFYTRMQLSRSAEKAGWAMRYIGEWGHPRHQRIALFSRLGLEFGKDSFRDVACTDR